MKLKENTQGVGCLILFALPFAVVGVFMAGLTVVTISKSARMSGWEKVPCRIVTTDIADSSDSDGSSYKAVATYTYTFEGKPYTADRVSVHGGSDNIGSFHQRVASELRRHRDTDTPFTCYVNPANPRQAILYPGVRWEMIAFYVVFALVFGGVGFGLIIGGIWAGRKVKREQARKTAMPDQPWMWKQEWSTGEIKSSNKGGVIGSLVFTVLWNLISVPAAVFAIADGVVRDGNKMALFVLIFPAVGLLMAVWTVRAVIQWRKFGTSTLKMASMPGVIGGKLAGVVTVPVHVTPEDGFHLCLRCIRRTTTGSGKNRRTSESIVWDDARTMARELFPNDPTRSAVPVLFAIPFDAQPTDESTSSNQIIWRLEVAAKVPGVDYAAKFDVPVFRTPESSPGFVLDESSIRPFAAEKDSQDLLRRSEVVITKRGAGTTEFYFPPARALGSAIGFSVFAIFWIGAVVVMIVKHAPLVFPVVFGLIGILIVWGMIDMWFGANRAAVTRDGLRVRGGLLALGKEQVIETSQIESIRAASNMQSGNQIFYNIKLHRLGGKSVTLGKYIRGRREAEAVIEAIQAVLTG